MAKHTLEELPRVLPLFPLPGVLLLPFGKLPLNVFEPRYLAMVRAALAGDWQIGMVQPTDPDSGQSEPQLYQVGCAGRITTLNETDDGRYLITLTGLCRFEIEEELPLMDGYRRAAVRWDRFSRDLRAENASQVDRDRLLPALRGYLDTHKISADWKTIESSPGDQLVTSLAMVCPFEPPEKQALLESPGLRERAELMISLLAMSVLDRSDTPGAAPH